MKAYHTFSRPDYPAGPCGAVAPPPDIGWHVIVFMPHAQPQELVLCIASYDDWLL